MRNTNVVVNVAAVAHVLAFTVVALPALRTKKDGGSAGRHIFDDVHTPVMRRLKMVERGDAVAIIRRDIVYGLPTGGEGRVKKGEGDGTAAPLEVVNTHGDNVLFPLNRPTAAAGEPGVVC